MDGTHESAHAFLSEDLIGIFEGFAIRQNGDRWLSNSRRDYPYSVLRPYPVEERSALSALAVELSAACRDGRALCVDVDVETAILLSIAGVLTPADFDQAAADDAATMLILPGVMLASRVVTLRIVRHVFVSGGSGILAVHRCEP